MSYDGPGIYRHYKGGHYCVLGLAVHEGTGAKLVIYRSYSVEYELERASFGVDFVARPLNPQDGEDAFNESVYQMVRTHLSDPMYIERFEKISIP